MIEPRFTLRDYLLLPFLGLYIILVLIIFDFIQRISLRRGKKRHLESVNALNRWFVKGLTFFGIEITVENHATLSPDRPYIIVANHQSLFDIPIIHTIFNRHYPKFIAKKELARYLPSVSFNLRYGGNAIIDRGNAQQAIDAIAQLGTAMVDEGFATVIFPEGTRAKDGMLKRFRPAGLATLLQSAPTAEIVPLTIDGSWKLAARNFFPVPLRTNITVIISASLEQVQGQSLKQMTSEIHGMIAHNLAQIREKR